MHTWFLRVPDAHSDGLGPSDHGAVWEEDSSADEAPDETFGTHTTEPSPGASLVGTGASSRRVSATRMYSVGATPPQGGIHLPLSVTLRDLDSGFVAVPCCVPARCNCVAFSNAVRRAVEKLLRVVPVESRSRPPLHSLHPVG